MSEEQYYEDLKYSRIKNHIEALKLGGCQIDRKGRVYYIVPTSVRRSGAMIIPDKTIHKLLKNGDIEQYHIDKLRPH